MPLAQHVRKRPIAYSVLHHATPVGRPIGSYADRVIFDAVCDDYGRHYVYAGIAPRTRSGELNDEALSPGEFILLPGLVYRLD